MGKVAVAAGATGIAGTGGLGIYGAHQMGWFEGSEAKRNQKYDGMYIEPEKTKFKKQNDVYCFGTYGEVFDKWASGGTVSSATPTLISSTNDVKLDSSGEVKSCLTINWDIAQPENQWKGSNFRFVWTLSKDKKGFAVYMTGTTQDTNQIEFDGVAYFFEQDGSGWKTTKYLDAKKTTLDSSSIKDKFPQKNTSLTGNGSNGISNKYWDFLDDSATKLKEGAPYNYAFWKFSSPSSSNSDLKSWSGNLETWWDHFFEKSKWNMGEMIKNINGSWH